MAVSSLPEGRATPAESNLTVRGSTPPRASGGSPVMRKEALLRLMVPICLVLWIAAAPPRCGAG